MAQCPFTSGKRLCMGLIQKLLQVESFQLFLAINKLEAKFQAACYLST